MRANGRASGEQKAKQTGRQEAVAHHRLPRKSRVRAFLGRSGYLWLDLPDERGHQVISPEEIV